MADHLKEKKKVSKKSKLQPGTTEVVAFGYRNDATGEIVGKLRLVPAKIFEKMVRRDNAKWMAFALVVGLGLGSVATVQIDNYIEEREMQDQIAYEQRYEEAKEIAEERVPVFTVEHVVKYGQSYWGIAESMYNDGNSQKQAYDDMVSMNHDYSPSMLRAGTTIKVPVPANQLENFGYTVNYNILKPEIEFNDKMDFIENYLNNFVPGDEKQTAILAIVNTELDGLRAYEDELMNLEDGPETDERYREALKEVDNVIRYIEQHLGVYIDGKDETVGSYAGVFKAPRAYEMNDDNLSYDYIQQQSEGRKLG